MESLNRDMLDAIRGKSGRSPRVEVLCFLSESGKEHTLDELRGQMGKPEKGQYDYLRQVLTQLAKAGWIRINQDARPHTFRIESKSNLVRRLFGD